MPQILRVILDRMSRLLFDMFEDSNGIPILSKRMSTPRSGRSKLGCGPFSKGHITRSNARPRKEDLCIGGSEHDDNNERTKLDEECTPPRS